MSVKIKLALLLVALIYIAFMREYILILPHKTGLGVFVYLCKGNGDWHETSLRAIDLALYHCF